MSLQNSTEFTRHSTVRIQATMVEGMRAARAYFPQIKAWLKRMGHDEVYVCIPEGDALLYKFERAFGFSEYKRINGSIIMMQRC